MSKDDIEAIVQDIFASLFNGLSDDEIRGLEAQSHDRWDSMAQVNLIAALEGEFDLVIDIDDAASLRSFTDCITYLRTKI